MVEAEVEYGASVGIRGGGPSSQMDCFTTPVAVSSSSTPEALIELTPSCLSVIAAIVPCRSLPSRYR
jgi:hypothetical protein